MAYSGDQSIIYVGGTGVTAQKNPTTYGDNMAQAYMEPNWTLESDTFGLVNQRLITNKI